MAEREKRWPAVAQGLGEQSSMCIQTQGSHILMDP